MVKPELGTKRICESCSSKFYDLNRDPIICPKCGTQFVIVEISAVIPESTNDKTQQAEAASADVDNEEDEEELVVSPDIISLEDAEDDDNDIDDDIPDDIPDFEDDEIEADDSDTFLETDDDEEDDVVGIIAPTDLGNDDS